MWQLTSGATHITDVTNASRTMLFNIHTLKWDDDLLRLLRMPASMLPEVRPSSEVYGQVSTTLGVGDVPIAGIAGDQQAALFGQMCVSPGLTKNTYGTGCFLLQNTGERPVGSHNRLLSTVAWQVGGKTMYALEGSVFIGGAVVQWLRDGLGIIKTSADVEALAAVGAGQRRRLPRAGLCWPGAPHWDPYARGTIVGITRGTTAGHIARAALESIAFQVADLLEAVRDDSGIELTELRVDGGARPTTRCCSFRPTARRPGRPAQCHRDDGARRGLSGRPGGRLLGLYRRARPSLACRQAIRAGDVTLAGRRRAAPSGARR